MRTRHDSKNILRLTTWPALTISFSLCSPNLLSPLSLLPDASSLLTQTMPLLSYFEKALRRAVSQECSRSAIKERMKLLILSFQENEQRTSITALLELFQVFKHQWFVFFRIDL